jgi:hypothetical protein
MERLTQAALRRLLQYDPESGHFTWKVNSGGPKRAGTLAGVNNRLGYRVIRINQKLMYAHRLAWIWMTGAEAPEEIDHINGDKSDNSWANLRAVNRSENMLNTFRAWKHNKSTGILGVSRTKTGAPFRATLRNKHLGQFDTAEQAKAAYEKAKAQR